MSPRAPRRTSRPAPRAGGRPNPLVGAPPLPTAPGLAPEEPREQVPAGTDPQGRFALYSSVEPEAPAASLVLACSSCLSETPVTPFELLRACLPFSLHLPFVRRYHSYLRCPACGRRTWTRLVVRS